MEEPHGMGPLHEAKCSKPNGFQRNPIRLFGQPPHFPQGKGLARHMHAEADADADGDGVSDGEVEGDNEEAVAQPIRKGAFQCQWSDQHIPHKKGR